jgi:16S rRNA (cytosine967-C5)-methyltransferase
VIFDNQLRHATAIIDAYKGEMPLHVWLKSFFRDNKQMGSRDRRLLSTLVYGYYRLGHAITNLSIEDRLLAGLFLCQNQPSAFLQHFHPDWNDKVALPMEEKILFYQSQPQPPGAGFTVTDIFPWPDELSPGIDHRAFCLSFLRQPDLFLRIRPGYEHSVRRQLDARPLVPGYEFIPPFTLRLPNGFKVDDYFTPDQEIVIQDYSSQQIAAFFPSPSPHSFWDACAASGGKSILAHDLYPNMPIAVSDVRESILHNLKGRFHVAGIKNYHAFIADLTRETPPLFAATAGLILADAPCTGSGTWSRTPEELCFFNPATILRYSTMQQQILTHIVPSLAPGAWLIYSTCSVFKKENEAIADFLRENFNLQEEESGNIKGYNLQADTMFAARFHRNK